MEIKDEYLGDGVYASYDGYHIVLDLRGQDTVTKIALENQTIENLNKYRDRITSVLEERHQNPALG